MPYLSNHTERELVKSLKKGNIVAFNSLFKNYSNKLYYFAMKYLKSEAEAEETVQEVFTRVWERRSELKTGLSFQSFIFTIAFNIIRKTFNRKSVFENYIRSQVREEFDLDTVKEVNFNSLKLFLDQIVGLLPEKRRQIFIKSRFEGCAINEIADELGISKKTVENQLTEALKFIRNQLTKEKLAGILFFWLFVL